MFVILVASAIVACAGTVVHPELPTVFDEWSAILDDHFIPFNQTGITQGMIEDTFSGGGSHVIFQYINQTLWIVDPVGYCLCNKTNYTSQIRFPFHLPRCQAIASLLTSSLQQRQHMQQQQLSDFELVWSVDDLPSWTIQPKSQINWRPKPGFGSIRCYNKGGWSLPFFGSHHPLQLESLDHFSKLNPTVSHRAEVAVFRGALERGCSFERDTVSDFDGNQVFSLDNRTSKCGRYLLAELAKQRPDLIDYQTSLGQWISVDDQAQRYQYVISVEGYGGWTDRLFGLIRQTMVVFDQEHPCDQWFEPLLQPYRHYIPVAHDFRNLIGRINWARAHPQLVNQIRQNARQFAQRYLSSHGILSYVAAILNKYHQLVWYQPTVRDDSYPVRVLWNQTFLNNLPNCRSSLHLR